MTLSQMPLPPRFARSPLPVSAGRDEKAHALPEGLCCAFAGAGPLCRLAIGLGWTSPFGFFRHVRREHRGQ